MDKLYIEIDKKTDSEEIFTTVSSFICLYVYMYLDRPPNIEVIFIQSSLSAEKGLLKLNRGNLDRIKMISRVEAFNEEIYDLRMPIYVKDKNTFIAGICAVCRELIARQPNPELHQLLGFKESCLLAPSEISIWTCFCEVNMVRALTELLASQSEGISLKEMPVEAVRFEQHMNEPVRMHNIYKLARNQAKQQQQQSLDQTGSSSVNKRTARVVIECSTPKEDLAIKHIYAEGVWFTIADLILYPSLKLLHHLCPGNLERFPLTKHWFQEVETLDSTCEYVLRNVCCFPSNNKCQLSNLLIPHVEAKSLYKSDTKRYKPRHRIFTEQSEVEDALNKVKSLQLSFNSDCLNTFNDKSINWSLIEPSQAENSLLPPQRLQRKRQQLENMANVVASMALPNERIIDFCSGTGHLGILLALQLPHCTIILMENKAESLNRAKERAQKLKLTNLKFYQCNIDYFEGAFDLGTSLHACGTATDIVLKQCRRARAKFVCCPCCYGALQAMPHITYPLSQRFREVLSSKAYMYIAHTADQAHALGTLNCRIETSRQGQLCMDIIDSDRKVQAEEAGYEVQLTRMKPESCTPKNRLLVGKPLKQF